MAKTLPEIFIIKDSREQKGWDFPEESKKPGEIRIMGTVVEGIDAGDYTIKGLEDKIRIERKFGLSELFNNMMPKENKDRFEREMEKLRKIPHKYILIETSLSDDLLNLSVPQMYHGPTCNKIMKWLESLEVEYNISVKYVGSCGKRVAKSIFESVARKYL